MAKKAKKEPTPATPEEQLEELCKKLAQKWEEWNRYYTVGGDDPSWEDGWHLKFLRNHISYYKEEIKDLCKKYDLQVPKECSVPMPPEIDTHYMARAEDIREKAHASLARYEADPNYQRPPGRLRLFPFSYPCSDKPTINHIFKRSVFTMGDNARTEYDFMKAFYLGADMKNKNDMEMGRTLWMAFCRHYGLRKGGEEYEHKLRTIYRTGRNTMPSFATYEGFSFYMGEYLA